jgi:hypothetical protein
MEVSTNLIEEIKIPRSKSLLIVMPGQADKVIGVVALIKGRDHINPLAQRALLQEDIFSFIFK